MFIHTKAAAMALIALLALMGGARSHSSRSKLSAELRTLQQLHPGNDFVVWQEGERRRYCERFVDFSQDPETGFLTIHATDRAGADSYDTHLIGDDHEHLDIGCPAGGIPF